MKSGKWSPDEIAVLVTRYPDALGQEIADTLGRSLQSVYSKSCAMNLTKSDAFFAGPNSGRTDGTIGNSTRFRKGDEPWSKGKKIGSTPGSRRTQFKKGGTPHNTLPIGTEVTTSDGYLVRKVSDTRIDHYTDWKFVHQLLWTEAHGEIPDGQCIVFKDGDRENVVLENLRSVNRTELMARNSIVNLPKPLFDVIHAKGRLTQQINIRMRADEKQNWGPARPPVRDHRGAERRRQPDGRATRACSLPGRR